jgi:hypothetical protein
MSSPMTDAHHRSIRPTQPSNTPTKPTVTSSIPSSRSCPRRRPIPPRDLAAEADYYAIVYPNRAQPIRRCGGLPPDYDFGPPDEDLVRAIVTGASPVLRALDGPAAGAA